MEDIVKEVLGAISVDDVVGDKALPLEKDQVSVPISKANFHLFSETKSSSQISFVDGGNAELLGAASFSLQLIRVAALTYENGKKTRNKDEFYLLIIFKDNKFEVQTFPEGKLPKLSFDSLDPGLRIGGERVLAKKVGGVCRRLAELQLASNLDGFVVLDGDLFSRYEQEKPLLEKLKEKRVSGVSKTSSLLTEKGRVFSAAISSLKDGDWYYHPVYENENVYFAKFHEKSNHVFKVDMFHDKKDELFSLLKKFSKDPVFLGYPYPLIEVDKMARISNEEVKYLRTRFMTKFGKDWSKVRVYLRTKNAHEILDNVQ